MKSNNGILTEKEIQKKNQVLEQKAIPHLEQERTSKDMQNLLLALKEFSLDEIKAIKKLNRYAFGTRCKKDPKFIVWAADQRDLDYAISIAPKTFKVKQG